MYHPYLLTSFNNQLLAMLFLLPLLPPPPPPPPLGWYILSKSETYHFISAINMSKSNSLLNISIWLSQQYVKLNSSEIKFKIFYLRIRLLIFSSSINIITIHP